jgi:hypothetical protein
MFTLACNDNPTKVKGLDKLLPWLQVMLDGYRKEDPATIKKLPVQLDVPELLVTTAYNGLGTEKDKAAANHTLIAFYYLLRVGEYTVKGSRCPKPSSQPRDAARREECSQLDEKSLTTFLLFLGGQKEVTKFTLNENYQLLILPKSDYQTRLIKT